MLCLAVAGLLPALAAAAPAVERPLALRQPVERAIAPGEVHVYTVQAGAGDFLQLSLRQRGADVALSIRDPRGRTVLEADLADFRFGQDGASLVAETRGRYRVTVRPVDREAPRARYILSWVERRPAQPADQDRLRAERAHGEAKALRKAESAESLRKAVSAYQAVREQWRRLGDTQMEAAALIDQAICLRSLGDAAPAQEAAGVALERFRAAGDADGEARAQHLLGEIAYHRSDYPAALGHMREAAAIRRRLDDAWGQAETQGNISVTLANMGQTGESVEAARQSLDLWRQVGHPQGVDSALSILAFAHYRRAEWQPALDLWSQALPLKRRFHDRDGEASTLVNVGTVNLRLGEPDASVDYFQRALALFRALGQRKGEGATLNNLGNAYDLLGQPARALDCYQRALALRRAVGDRQGEAVTLINLASLDLAGDRLDAASGRIEEALTVLEQVDERSSRADALGYRARVQAARGETAQARATLDQVLALKRAIVDRQGEVTALYHLARLARDGGDLAEARRRIEEAVALVESQRTALRSGALRASYAASLRDVYELYIDILSRLHERDPAGGLDAEALRASERGRARSLLDLLLDSRADVREGADPDLRERERTLHDRLSVKLDQQVRVLSRAHTDEQAESLAREVDALTAEYDDVRSRLRSASPRYAALTQPALPTLAAIQGELLDADTVLLEYALGKQGSRLWVVTSGSVALHALPPAAEIEQAARAAVEHVSRRPSTAAAAGAQARALESLSRTLLAPAAAAVAGRRMVIVPDGALHYLPFAALPDPDGSGRALVHGHEVVTLPSVAVLAVLREELGQRAPAPKAVAVLADPVFDHRDERLAHPAPGRPPAVEPVATRAARAAGLGGGLPRLPFTRREAQAILALVPAEARKRALDFDASRATATAPELGDYRYVHFATHGFVNPARPDLSGIVLSLVDREGRDQNGFLAAPEVFNLKLGADLVVLSGCRTGWGREVKGEGLVGLTRAFMYAGAPRVLASLWKVDDAATAELMAGLYRGILEQHLAPSTALRQAQLALARTPRWRDPYFWAAFQLHGDWKTPEAR
jgi:CHAT domain-containing protein/tetratricopeptide (TPR) repeat protein